MTSSNTSTSLQDPNRRHWELEPWEYQSQVGSVQNFEKEEYSASIDLRAKRDSRSIGPNWAVPQRDPRPPKFDLDFRILSALLSPDPETGNNPFGGIRELQRASPKSLTTL